MRFERWLLWCAALLALAGNASASLPAPCFTGLRYDADSNLTNSSRTGVSPVNVSLRYDNWERLTNATTTATGGPAWSVGYGYDRNGNTTNIVYPGGLNVRYGFDGQDRLTSVTWSNVTATFAYDDAGHLTGIAYPNGVTSTYTPDAMGRIVGIQHGAFINRTIHRNDAGYKVQENVDAGYAPAPSVAKKRVNDYNAADRLTASADTPGGAVSYAYDLRGNLTSVIGLQLSVTNTFTWDADNRLIAVVAQASPPVSFLYDGTGNRVGKVASTTTNYFVVNQAAGLKNVLVELNSAGAVTRSYIWGPNGLLAHIDADGTTRYYHGDDQGSTLALTDANGNVTDQFAYTPQGVLLGRTGSTTTPYTWLGGVAVRDEGAGLFFMLNRYYSSDQKRFLSEDPAGIDSFPNLYAYANGNPAFLTDPFGLCAESGGSSFVSQMWGGAMTSLGMAGGNQNAYWQDRAATVQYNQAADAAWQSLGTGQKVMSTLPVVGSLSQGRYDLAALDVGMLLLPGPKTLRAESGALRTVPRTAVQLELNFGQSLPWLRGESGLVIGRNTHLSVPGALAPGEYRLNWLSSELV